MSRNTKLGSASRFGPRYSTSLKEVVRDIEVAQKTKQVCPQCGRKALKRKGYAKWECSKCGAVMAGGAYEPKTAVGGLVEKIVSRQASPDEMRKLTKQLEDASTMEKGEEVTETEE